MPFSLPSLPYALDALAPALSPETLEFHYGKHHATYVNNLNNLVKGSPEEHTELESLILRAEGGVLNNAAQVWNHTFYWQCMKPGGGGKPHGDLLKELEKSFGSYEKFVELFVQAATTQFGSGWAWLVLDQGKLAVTKTSNADLPMRHGQQALLTLDVWEHAYYIDYRNARPAYIQAFFEKLLHWDFVAENYAQARKRDAL